MHFPYCTIRSWITDRYKAHSRLGLWIHRSVEDLKIICPFADIYMNPTNLPLMNIVLEL